MYVLQVIQLQSKLNKLQIDSHPSIEVVSSFDLQGECMYVVVRVNYAFTYVYILVHIILCTKKITFANNRSSYIQG